MRLQGDVGSTQDKVAQADRASTSCELFYHDDDTCAAANMEPGLHDVFKIENVAGIAVRERQTQL